MPRGKYVNHKGRSRHFTSPEELQNETSSEEDSTSAEGEGEDGKAGTSSGAAKVRAKPKPRTAKKGAAPSSSEEDSDEESSEEDDRGAKKGVASLIEIENPNRAVKKTAQKIKDLSLDGDAEAPATAAAAPKPELTRREREQIEKQKARQRYEKLHAAGKTSEAKADLARLALIRQQRADAAAKREAEKKAVGEKKGGSKA